MYVSLLTRQGILFWVVGLLVLVLLVTDLVRNKLTIRKLHQEFRKLNKISKPNFGYELVLKAMKLSTWTINTQTNTVTYESDYRDGLDSYTPSPNTNVFTEVECIHPDDAERVRQSLKNICGGIDSSYHEQYRVVKRNGGGFYWAESFATVGERDSEGRPLTVVGTNMRIDERKKMDEALVHAYQKAEEGNRLKSAFLASMSHEIRTPLNSIVGFSNLLINCDDPEQREECVRNINKGNEELLQLIDDIFKLSESEAGSANLLITPVNVNSFIRELSSRFSAVNQNKNVVFKTNLPDKPCVIETDRSIVEQILCNFIDNAMKFTKSGFIEIGFLPRGEHAGRLYVKDTGKGIPPEEHNHIFERFVKLNDFIQGTGLGLSVCKSFAYNINANVGVDSAVGKGSTFWLDVNC